MAHDGLGLCYCNRNRFTLVAMKANELMIGDWLHYYDEDESQNIPVKIVSIDDDEWCFFEFPDGMRQEGWCKNLYPIPLTPEILEKNGFVKIQATVISTWNCSVDGMYSMSIDINRETGNISGHFHSDVNRARLFCPVNHVHELQNSTRLCGIEKEIVL